MIREARLHAEAGMRPRAVAVISARVDVTKRPDLWPAGERDYRGAGRLELLD